MGLEIPVSSDPNNGITGVVFLHDVPVNGATGNLVNDFGIVMGTIIYATGVCEVTPTAIKVLYQTVYTPVTSYISG